MICTSCGVRYAPRKLKDWVIEDGKDGQGFCIKPVSQKAEKEYQELFDSDFKCPCRSCSFS